MIHPNDDYVPILRSIDAAANRAREGLRVVEDGLRFTLDDAHLTEVCKVIRHELSETLKRIPWADRLAARETQADVGTTLTTPQEGVRTNLDDVLTANLLRVQEALRSLEEFGKTVDPAMAARLEQLRYRVYTLHRSATITLRNIERLAESQLYVLLDGRESVAEFELLIRTLVASEVDVIQLRDKRMPDRELVDRARRLRELTRGTPTLFIMNDRLDLAALSQADGVHVGQDELSVKDARAIVGPKALIGVSTHTLEQARQAVLDGADYIGCGPTFPSGTKTFDHFPGTAFLSAVAAEIRLPAFAIGGITNENIGSVKQAGFGRVAVSGAVVGTEDVGNAVRKFQRTLKTEKY
jgi:thiamine-phosphate pyrophosphorylase